MLYRSIKPLVVDAVQVEEAREIETDAGILLASSGDWLIRDAQGNILVCDDTTFKCTYDKLAGWQGLESLQESKPCGC